MLTAGALCAVLMLALCACDRPQEPQSLRLASESAQTVQTEPADFAGSYSSNWGPAQCTQTHNQVQCVYTVSGARMDCEAKGIILRCTWVERTGRGKAWFKRHPNGNLVGTWGYRQSDSNRGAWMLTRQQ
jgi:hypothetical protein